MVCSPTWPVLIWGLFPKGSRFYPCYHCCGTCSLASQCISCLSLLSFHEFFMAFLCCANHRSLRWKAPKFERQMAARLAVGKLLRESARTLPSKRRDWSSTGSILRSCKGMLGFLGTIFAQLKKRLDRRAKPNPLAWLVHFFWRIANHDPIGFLDSCLAFIWFDKSMMFISIIIVLSILRLSVKVIFGAAS